MNYALHLGIFVLLFGMLALSLNISSGFSQAISLAHAAFFGIGAYTTALLSISHGWPIWLTILAAVTITAAAAIPVGLVALRTVDDYFILCTLGLQVVTLSLMNNWMELTGGPLGVAGIPPVTVLSQPIVSKLGWIVLVMACYVGMFTIARNIKRSAFGRLLVALGEDEILCQSLGKNVGLAKMQAFVLSAAIAAVPGVLYAHYVSFIDPSSFAVAESVFILSIVLLGGLGSLWGSLAASAFLILVPEALRLIGLPTGVAANVRQMLSGSALALIVWFQRDFRRR